MEHLLKQLFGHCHINPEFLQPRLVKRNTQPRSLGSETTARSWPAAVAPLLPHAPLPPGHAPTLSARIRSGQFTTPWLLTTFGEALTARHKNPPPMPNKTPVCLSTSCHPVGAFRWDLGCSPPPYHRLTPAH